MSLPCSLSLNMAKWSEDQTYKFVQEYLRHECLYNPREPTYKHKGAREAALLKISETINIPGFGVRETYHKIRNLKSTYSQELKKIKERSRSGAGVYVYVPQMKWFKMFDDALKAATTENMDQNTLESDTQAKILDNLQPFSIESSQYAKLNNPEESSEHMPNNLEEPIDASELSPLPRKRGLWELNSIDEAKNIGDANVAASNAGNNSTQTDSEFDIFGKSVAAQLKSMSLKTAIEGQMFIQIYLSNLRLQEMGHEVPTFVQSPSRDS